MKKSKIDAVKLTQPGEKNGKHSVSGNKGP